MLVEESGLEDAGVGCAGGVRVWLPVGGVWGGGVGGWERVVDGRRAVWWVGV